MAILRRSIVHGKAAKRRIRNESQVPDSALLFCVSDACFEQGKQVTNGSAGIYAMRRFRRCGSNTVFRRWSPTGYTVFRPSF